MLSVNLPTMMKEELVSSQFGNPKSNYRYFLRYPILENFQILHTTLQLSSALTGEAVEYIDCNSAKR